MTDEARQVWGLLRQITEGIVNHVVPVHSPTPCAHGAARPSTKELVMEIIISHPDGIRLKDIAHQVHRTPGSISPLIEMLVQDGMVERKVLETDRRAVTIQCTEAGMRERNKFVGGLDRYFAGLLQPIAGEDRKVFIQVLTHIAHRISDDTAERSISSGNETRPRPTSCPQRIP